MAHSWTLSLGFKTKDSPIHVQNKYFPEGASPLTQLSVTRRTWLLFHFRGDLDDQYKPFPNKNILWEGDFLGSVSIYLIYYFTECFCGPKIFGKVVRWKCDSRLEVCHHVAKGFSSGGAVGGHLCHPDSLKRLMRFALRFVPHTQSISCEAGNWKAAGASGEKRR